MILLTPLMSLVSAQGNVSYTCMYKKKTIPTVSRGGGGQKVRQLGAHLIRAADVPLAVERVRLVWHWLLGAPPVNGVPVRFHIILAREPLLANVALEPRQHVAARQLMTLQVAAPFEQLETPGAVVLRSDTALFGQMKAQVRLPLVVPAAVRTQPTFFCSRRRRHMEQNRRTKNAR